MNISELYTNANNKCLEICEQSISNHTKYLGEITELVACLKRIMDKVEKIELKEEIVNDFFSSTFFCSNGLYRNSYISLRCAFEMSLYQIYFYDNNYKYLLWKNNQFDILWAKLNKEDDGILNNKYLRLFNNSNDYKEFIEKVSYYYRESSEYVHGKYEYLASIGKYNYNENTCENILKFTIQVCKILIVLYDLRFNVKNEIDLQLVDDCYKDMELVKNG